MTKARNIANIASDGSALADGTINYTDVSGTPTLATVATSGAYADVTGTPTLAAVATSGSFNDLSNQPSPFDPNTLATVATTGAYADVTGTPTLGTAAATNTTAYATAAQGTLADSATQPGDLAAVATTGAYGNLSGTPTLGTAAATNATAYATAAQGTLADTATQPGDLAAVATSGAYSSLSGVPALAAVATSGSYSSLSGTPAIPAPAHNPVSVSGTTQALNVGTYNFFNAGDLSANTTISFTSVPTDALWTYTATAGIGTGYTFAAGVVYSYNSISIIAQESKPYALAFSSDGTKMYMVGEINATIYQYTLSTAWDVSTATYSGLSKSVNAQETVPTGMTFKPDGLTMYIVGQVSDTVYQYTLSTAWAINTATYASLSKSVNAQESNPTGMAFSSDGLKMYIVGVTNKTVYQYTLSTAWAVNTATYASLSKNVGPEDGSPQDMAFSSDGLRMFIAGDIGNYVRQYTLSTAWAINTATYASLNLYVGSQDAEPFGIAFSSDGSKIYMVGGGTRYVYQYNNTALPVTITVPAAVQNPPTTAFNINDQVSYTFVTNDGGTTVKLINEEAC